MYLGYRDKRFLQLIYFQACGIFRWQLPKYSLRQWRKIRLSIHFTNIEYLRFNTKSIILFNIGNFLIFIQVNFHGTKGYIFF
ncbi:hypothetical protein HMPREF2600_00175 [Neisseria sp. HMSC077D05]|nr:hypothetical protein HMPREF2600_00175 [Neisseria sp. HMSC077D05]